MITSPIQVQEIKELIKEFLTSEDGRKIINQIFMDAFLNNYKTNDKLRQIMKKVR